MMAKLGRRGEELARDAQRKRVESVAASLRAMFQSGAVAVDEEHVILRGKGLIKRWLTDPQLRFLK